MRPQSIGLRALVKANRKALKDHKLGAQQSGEFLSFYGTCRYVYGKTACGCAIGVALNPAAREAVVNRGLNTQGVRHLVDSSIVTEAKSYQHRRMREFLQAVHDKWAKRDRVPHYFTKGNFPSPLIEAWQGENVERFINEQSYTKLLDAIEASL